MLDMSDFIKISTTLITHDITKYRFDGEHVKLNLAFQIDFGLQGLVQMRNEFRRDRTEIVDTMFGMFDEKYDIESYNNIMRSLWNMGYISTMGNLTILKAKYCKVVLPCNIAKREFDVDRSYDDCVLYLQQNIGRYGYSYTSRYIIGVLKHTLYKCLCTKCV